MASLSPLADKIDRLSYAAKGLVGKIIDGIPLNRITQTVENERCLYLKQRCWYTPLLVYGANKFLGPNFRVLSTTDWYRREAAIYRAVHKRQVRIDPAGALQLPELEGVPLTQFLRSASNSRATKIIAYTAAVEALWRLHLTRLARSNDDADAYLSHGDATARNVIYNSAVGTAHWFDFETVHDSQQTREWRRADDLRALIYSAAAALPSQEIDFLVRATVAAYPVGCVLEALGRSVIHRRQHANLFHFAQAGLSYEKNLRLENQLLRELSSLDPWYFRIIELWGLFC